MLPSPAAVRAGAENSRATPRGLCHDERMARSGELMLQVRILGRSVIETGTTALPVDRPLERALAVRLALARGAAVPDQTLIDDLWGDPAIPIKRLRVVVHRLRQTLGDHADAVQRTSSGYATAAQYEPMGPVVDSLLGSADLVEAGFDPGAEAG
jgi:DNA-binding response OmpR family regulator